MSGQEIFALLPIAILGVGSVAVLLAGAFMPDVRGRYLNLCAALIALASAATAAFYQPEVLGVADTLNMGNFGSFFTAIVGVATFLTLLLSVGYTERRPLGHEEFPALALFAAFGMSFLASATSLLGIFIGLESMTLALYVLLASNRSDPLSGEAGLKYLVVGAVSTAFFAFGLSLIYAATGTLSVAGAMGALTLTGKMGGVGLAGWAMLIVGFGFKASLFPFHLWAPDVYEGGPAPVVAFLSTGSKAAVFAAFIRLAMATGAGWASLVPVLWVMAAFTMAFGNIAALTQDNVKRLLAYSSIAQMGYVLVALIAAPATGGGAAVFYIVAYMAMDLGAFGVVASFSGKDFELKDIGRLRGAGYLYPYRGAALAFCMLSLAGLPPTAGFIGKFGVFYAAVEAGYVYLAVIGIVTAIISVYYYLRVVVYLYMRPAEEVEGGAPLMPGLDIYGGMALTVIMAVILYLGMFPGRLLDFIAVFTTLGAF